MQKNIIMEKDDDMLILKKEIKSLKNDVRLIKKTLNEINKSRVLLKNINNDLNSTNADLLILPAIKQKFEDLTMEQYNISTKVLYSKLRKHPLPGLRAVFSFVTTNIAGIDKTTMSKVLKVDRTTISYYNEMVSSAIENKKYDNSIYYIYNTIGLELIKFIKKQMPVQRHCAKPLL